MTPDEKFEKWWEEYCENDSKGVEIMRWDVRAAWDEQQKEIDRLGAALGDIALFDGPEDQDRLKHASYDMDCMVAIAKAALKEDKPL